MIRLTTDSDSLFCRFVVELLSYTFVLVPSLVVFIVESDASLKFWHAVNQLPYHEQEITTQTDSESNINVDATHQAEVSAVRKAVKKLARRELIGKFCIGLTLLSIAVFEQYLAFSGMLDYSLPNSEGDYTFDDFDPPVNDEYSWYYNPTFGQIDWAKSCYAIVVFWTAIFLTARAVYMLSGLKERIVLRHTTGMPFVVPIISRSAASLCTTRVAVFVILLSTFITAGALFDSTVCSAGVYASLIHFNIANVTSAKSLSSKDIIGRGFIIITFLVLGIWRVVSEESPEPIAIFYLPKQQGSFGWASQIMSALVCSSSFNIMAFFYRVDHAFARPEELLVGAPDVAITVDQEVEVLGTRLSYAHSHCATAEPHSNFNKPYFHATVWSWLAAYAIIAALKVSDYIACYAESAGIFAMFIAPPIISIGVMMCALVKGEVKKLWAYKEDWIYESADAQLATGPGPGVLLCEEKGLREVKILFPELAEKTSPWEG